PLPCIEVDESGKIKLPMNAQNIVKATKQLGSPIHAVKIKLHPRNASEAHTLRCMFGIVRWCYNETVRMVNTMDKVKLKDVRKQFLNSDSDGMKEHPWLSHLSYDIRDAAAKDCLTALKGCKTRKE